MRNGLRIHPALVAALCATLAGCSLATSRPQQRAAAPAAPPAAATTGGERPPEQAGQGAAIAGAAAALIGAPYHFGGADEAGFDCSGLALYVHERAGLAIPRTASEQQHAAQPVPIGQILPGDLLFFRIRKRGIDHVGVYVGAGQFVHAPHAGGAVALADLNGGFYARHIAGAGRFWEPAAPAR